MTHEMPTGRSEGECRSAPYEGSLVSAGRPLTTRQAAAVVADRIEQFGLGALPSVSVTELDDGSWSVRWECLERTVAPMDIEAWTAWLEENVGPLDAESLDTSEG